jgi:hypothetical protein
MRASARITKRTAASISFGFGSFILMADALVVVITTEGGGNLFERGFPTILGWLGLALWILGIILLITHMSSGDKGSALSVRPVFLKGRKAFKCRNCGTRIDASGTGYHKRMRCKCGSLYDVYQEPDKDR